VDLVTVADRTVEKLIRGRLGEVFPEHGIYGEEGTRERMESEYRGTWTRWMERPTSLMDSRSSAFRWDWSTGPRARGR